MIIANLWGQPGAGKSTTAAGVFSTLKLHGVRAELVNEFAKDMTWEENRVALSEPSYILGQQMLRLKRLQGKVDVVVTDSPILMCTLYTPADYPASFKKFAWDLHSSFDNVEFLIRRVKPYDPVGRNQTEPESDELGTRIAELLAGHVHHEMDGNQFAPPKISEMMLERLRIQP